MHRLRIRTALGWTIALTGVLAGCGSSDDAAPAEATPPPEVLGTFEDDYGIRYVVTTDEWTQLPSSRLRIERWVPNERYLIAQNDSSHPTEPNLWTRIDWIDLEALDLEAMGISEFGPYRWAFCLSAYDAESAEAAEATDTTNPEEPLTGCNGFPFSRMKPVE